MTELSYNYQLDLLRYIVRTKEIKVLVQTLDSKIFSSADLRSVFDIVQAYEKAYHVTPKLNSLLEFTRRETAGVINLETLSVIEKLIHKCYEDLQSDLPFMYETLVDFAKRQMIRGLFVEYAGKIDTMNDEDYTLMLSKIKKISMIGQEGSEVIPGQYLFKDLSFDRALIQNATPFFLNGVNQLTAAGGFYSPQLVIFMAEPKGFKTGVILSAAVDFAVFHHKKVLYCDTENGIQPLIDRAQQKIASCTFEDLVKGSENDKITNVAGLALKNGGEIRFEYFPATISTLDDVEDRMISLAEDGFRPDIIIYDYFDKFGAADKSIKEKRLKIQNIYDHAIRLNNKYEMFAISVSQVSKEAVGSAIIDMTDFAEDFGKAANCHAAFAICRTQWEKDNGYAHIISVAQRQGARYVQGVNECFVRIKEDRMFIEQVTDDEARTLRNILGIEAENTVGQISGPITDD